MLTIRADYPRYALVTVQQKSLQSGSDELAAGQECQMIDVIIAILAIQGHSSIRAHPHMFGWKRLHWRECPILFHQSNASNHEGIIELGLFPGGPDKYYGRSGPGGQQGRWCVFTSLADGHGYIPNCSMIEGAPAVPYKFRKHGVVYAISAYYVEVIMKVGVWRTDAWCGMPFGWVPPEAIPYAFDAVTKECWYVGKKRHEV